jgi:hypothetical protein
MLQNVAAEIIACYERARLACEKSEHAIDKEFKAELPAAEDNWLALTLGYARPHAPWRTVAAFDRRGKAGAITRMLRMQGPGAALRTRTGQLRWSPSGIVDFAAQGELDPERLTAATVEALSPLNVSSR